MSGINKVILLGRLVRDPEVKDAKGMMVANFSLATSRSWTDESGERQEKVEYHNIVAFKKTAEIVGKFLKKGSQIFLEGELQTRSWEDDSGAKKYKTEVITRSIEFLSKSSDNQLGNKDESERQETQAAPKATKQAQKKVKNFAPGAVDEDEEIPF